ncbi:Got1/Sft2-like vescicle transport protein family [Zea mays]|nr:Got1/Sft2-like vescicle transport protein family [Zea mays]
MELYGSFVLFSGYGPPIQAFLYQIPIIGWILQYPFQVSLYFTEDFSRVFKTLLGQLRRKRT